MTRKPFLHYRTFGRWIHRSPADSHHRRPLMLNLEVVFGFRPTNLLTKRSNYRWFLTHAMIFIFSYYNNPCDDSISICSKYASNIKNIRPIRNDIRDRLSRIYWMHRLELKCCYMHLFVVVLLIPMPCWLKYKHEIRTIHRWLSARLH